MLEEVDPDEIADACGAYVLLVDVDLGLDGGFLLQLCAPQLRQWVTAEACRGAAELMMLPAK